MSDRLGNALNRRPNPTCELVLITPEKAERFLRDNTGNRNISALRVKTYANSMTSGRWRGPGATGICFDWNGRMYNGQHRLLAIIRSGVPVLAWVLRGLDPESFKTDDIGKNRSNADALGILGIKHPKTANAAANWVAAYLCGQMERGKSNLTADEAERMLQEDHPGIIESGRWDKHGGLLSPPSLWVALHYLFSLKDVALADELLSAIDRGVAPNTRDPFYLLRCRLEKQSNKNSMSDPYKAAITIKAWNFKRKGEPVRCLRWRDEGETAESFPEIQ